MARWSDLRRAIFGDRVVEDAGDLVAIDAPTRAEDAAIVPVSIRVAETLAPEIRGLYLVIDDNPQAREILSMIFASSSAASSS